MPLNISPRFIVFGLTAHLALRLGVLLPAGFGHGGQHETALDAIRIVGALTASGLALLICWRMADEYREAKWMRLAWLALTANAALSFIRPLVRSPLPLPGQEVDLYVTPPLHGLLLHLVLTPANLCLLLGLLALWWAYREIGLGFRLEWRDGVLLGGLFVLMCAFLYFRELLTEAQAVYRATTLLQFIGQIQLFLIAAAGLLLHRVSVQMGSGRLAIVLRWLTVYALLRLGLVLAVSLARAAWPAHVPFITDIADFGWQAAPWVFALAVACHAELTALAAQRLAILRQQRLATNALAMFVCLFAVQSVFAQTPAAPAYPTDVRVETDVAFLAAGRPEKADLYFPQEMPKGKRLPAVVIIHGGGFNDGDKARARELNIGGTLARNGYLGMSINYKLAKNADSSFSATWPQPLHDAKTAVRWLRKHAARLQIDPNRIGVIGGSAGGTLAALLALTGPQDKVERQEPYGEFSARVQCAVDFYGPAKLLDYHDMQTFGKTRAEAPQLYEAASPTTYVDKRDAPLLIVHGTADKTVHHSQSEALAAACQKAGAPCELVLIEGAPHTFDLQPKQRDLRPLVLGFFDKHLKRP